MNLLNSLLFWKYYFEKERPDRDEKLEQVADTIIMSNIGLLFLLIILISKISEALDMVGPEMGFMLLLSLIYILIQTIFQVRTCFDAMKRNYKIDSVRKEIKEGFKAVAVFTQGMAIFLTYSLADEFKKIINEFYKDYQSSNNKQSYYNEFKYNSDQNLEEEIELIFKKYDLTINSEIKDIKKRFRDLAKKYHPDMPNGDEKLFIELREDMYFLMEYAKNNEI